MPRDGVAARFALRQFINIRLCHIPFRLRLMDLDLRYPSSRGAFDLERCFGQLQPRLRLPQLIRQVREFGIHCRQGGLDFRERRLKMGRHVEIRRCRLEGRVGLLQLGLPESHHRLGLLNSQRGIFINKSGDGVTLRNQLVFHDEQFSV